MLHWWVFALVLLVGAVAHDNPWRAIKLGVLLLVTAWIIGVVEPQ